jgi:hypothetical protein
MKGLIGGIRFLLVLVLLALGITTAQAQGSDAYGKGYRIELGDSGRKYIRIINWHQFWVRYMENNPHTLVNGQPTASQTDFLLRRSRINLIMQLTPKFLIFTHLGINNQTILQGGQNKPTFFIHDATVEHKIFKDYCSLGSGLHYWHGVSRISNAGVTSFMPLDAPIFAFENFEVTDQFVRSFGIFAKGKIGKLDYRIAVNQPFLLNKDNPFTKLDVNAAKNGKDIASYRGYGIGHKAVLGYFMYQFGDQELNLLPYLPGTYIGTKKVFNIGAGFYHQPDQMWSLNPQSKDWTHPDTTYHNQTLWAVDLFLDVPLGEKKHRTALTAYLAYFNSNYGPNFIRNNGIANIASGVSNPLQNPVSAGGDAFPTFGTGHIYYGELGFALPQMGKVGRLQPYFRMTYGDFERIQSPVQVVDVGTNLFMEGHQCKLSLNYRMRPTFKYENPAQPWRTIVHEGFKPEIILQMQIAL